MPAIHAEAGDPIEISITGADLVARIMTKTPEGKWEIELSGDPPMRGKVDLAQYEWSHEGKCWRKMVQVTTGLAPQKDIARSLDQLRALGS